MCPHQFPFLPCSLLPSLSPSLPLCWTHKSNMYIERLSSVPFLRDNKIFSMWNTEQNTVTHPQCTFYRGILSFSLSFSLFSPFFSPLWLLLIARMSSLNFKVRIYFHQYSGIVKCNRKRRRERKNGIGDKGDEKKRKLYKTHMCGAHSLFISFFSFLSPSL